MYDGVPTRKEGVLAQRAVREFRRQDAPHCCLHPGFLGRERMGHHRTRQCKHSFDVKPFYEKKSEQKENDYEFSYITNAHKRMRGAPFSNDISTDIK